MPLSLQTQKKESKEKAEVDCMQKKSDTGQQERQACLGSITIREE